MRAVIIVTITTLWLGFVAAAHATGSTVDEERIRRLAAGENVDGNAKAQVINLLGPKSEEEHGQMRTAIAARPLSEQAKRGFRSTFVYSGWNWVERHLMATDPTFNLDAHFDSLKQGIPSQYWNRFGGMRSMQEASELRGEILRELADQDVITHSDSAGYSAYMLGKTLIYIAILVLMVGIRQAWLRTFHHKE